MEGKVEMNEFVVRIEALLRGEAKEMQYLATLDKNDRDYYDGKADGLIQAADILMREYETSESERV